MKNLFRYLFEKLLYFQVQNKKVNIEHPELIMPNVLTVNSKIRGMVHIGEYSKIIDATLNGNIYIGRHTTFNGPNSDIWALVNSVRIGNYCSIARNVSIQEYDHYFNRISSYFIHANLLGGTMQDDIISKGDVFIGNDVWIGTQCVILSGASISDGAVIGANSVVNSFIPPYAIAIGSPAKVVKFRFSDEIIRKLLNLKWWDWNDEKIRSNRLLFDSPLTEEKLDQII